MSKTPNPKVESPADSAAVSSRRLLYWLVFGVALLNVVLFLKFGLKEKGQATHDPAASNSVAPPQLTNPAAAR